MSREDMYNKIYTLMIFLIIILSIVPIVSSAPPFTTLTSQTSLQIEAPAIPVLKIGESKEFHAHVINLTSSKTNLTTSCIFHLYNSSGTHLPIGNQFMSFDDNGIDFDKKVSGGNFSSSGTYAYVIQCNSTNEVGFFRGQFQVTPNGEIADTGTSIFYIGLLGVLLFFLALTVYAFMTFDNLLNRVGMLGMSYLLLIAVTFIGWNMAENFLTSSPFLIDMLRILFYVLIIGALPLLVGAFAWYLIMISKIKEIENLMKKGMPHDEAERRVSRR